MTSDGPCPFVLVHGAWHGGWCWAHVAQRLQQAGHRVFAPSLTGLADRAHLFGAGVTLATHVEDVVRLIEWESLDGCVLVGHSYGGNVISGVADRLRERVAHYVFLDAVVPDDDAQRWRWADFNSEADREARLLTIAGAGAGVALPPPAPEVFGIVDPDQLRWVGEHMTPMPAGTYLGEIRFENGASRGLPRTYIAADAPPFASMKPIYARVREDPTWNWQTIACGHDAMVIRPDLLADILLRLAA
jgi:pimeloyl-ACP methyl ester carboxylesterase